MFECIICGKSMTTKSKLCSDCEASLMKEQSLEQHCPICGIDIDPNATMCYYCGNKITTDPLEVEDNRKIPDLAVSAGLMKEDSLDSLIKFITAKDNTSIDTSPHIDTVYECSVCRTIVAESDTVCKGCGVNFLHA